MIRSSLLFLCPLNYLSTNVFEFCFILSIKMLFLYYDIYTSCRLQLVNSLQYQIKLWSLDFIRLQ